MLQYRHFLRYAAHCLLLSYMLVLAVPEEEVATTAAAAVVAAAAASDTSSAADDIMNIGGAKQLLVDFYAFEKTSGASIQLGRPTMSKDPVFSLTAPWETGFRMGS